MKKLFPLLLILILLFSACTQQMTDEEILARAEEIQSEQATATPEVTAEATVEPTATPSATPEPISLTAGLEPFDNYYTELKDNENVTSAHWDILRDAYEYGIIARFDDGYNDGRESDIYKPLSDEYKPLAIESLGVFLKTLNPNNTEVGMKAVGEPLRYIYFTDKIGASGRSLGDEIAISFGASDINYNEYPIVRNMISEWANLFFAYYDINLIGFAEYNEFPKYESELKEGDQHFINDVLRPLEGVDDKLWLNTLRSAGLLSYDGYNGLDDDVAQHPEGMFLNAYEYWLSYAISYFSDLEDNQTLFKKANYIMNEMGKINPEWGLKNMYGNPDYNPYFISEEGFNIDDYVED